MSNPDWSIPRREAVRKLVATLSVPAFGSRTVPAAGGAEREVSSEEEPLVRVEFRVSSEAEESPGGGASESAVVTGRVLVRAQDGGILIEDRAGRLRAITPDRLISEEPVERVYERLPAEELAGVLVEEAREAGIGGRFETHLTSNYTIVTSAPMTYARWSARLLERMQRAFQAYWQNRRFELNDLEAPLPVLILKDRSEFAKLARFDGTPGSAQGQGYYLVTANRVVLYDLTASERATPATTIAEIQRRLQQSPAGVATVVHEAIHQAAFNRGMHTRYADNPLWLTEGMAMYFETPDLKSRRGWSTIGRVNSVRLARFRDYVRRRRTQDSLKTLLQDNSRFADAELAADAYAEAWALTYFLVRRRTGDFVRYLKKIAAKPPLVWDTPEETLDELRNTFETDLAALDREFLAAMSRLL